MGVGEVNLFGKVEGDDFMVTQAKSGYRNIAFEAYPEEACAYCGFGIRAILEVAHLDQNRANNSADNLAVLCPTCHKMHDIGLIPTAIILLMRDQKKDPNWLLRMKDAATKAATTRKANTARMKRSTTANKAVLTRRENAAKKQKKDTLPDQTA